MQLDDFSIKLPSANCFFNYTGQSLMTNTYCGSIGTDPSYGCMGKMTISYKVQPVGSKNEDENVINLSIWNVPAYMDNTSEKWKEETVLKYEGQKTVDEAAKWLFDQVANVLKKYGENYI